MSDSRILTQSLWLEFKSRDKMIECRTAFERQRESTPHIETFESSERLCGRPGIGVPVVLDEKVCNDIEIDWELITLRNLARNYGGVLRGSLIQEAELCLYRLDILPSGGLDWERVDDLLAKTTAAQFRQLRTEDVREGMVRAFHGDSNMWVIDYDSNKKETSK